MAEASGFFARAWSFIKTLTVSAVVLASMGGALWALSRLNEKRFRVEARAGQLVVLKGRALPTGFEPYLPSDPALADTYAPVDTLGARADLDQIFDDRDALDRALFSVLETQARPRVTSTSPAELAQGLALLRRAERLNGITEAQRSTLRALRAEVSFFVAQNTLEQSQRSVDEALAQLRLATQHDAKHAKEATQMLLAVEPHAKAFSDALRAAIHQLPSPAVTPATPPAASPTDGGAAEL
jgi:hypothetical protein